MPMSKPVHRFQGPIRAILASIALILLNSSGATAIKAGPVAEPINSAAADGWIELFEGESTSAWRGYRKDTFPEKGWAVKDGWLQVLSSGGGGDIVTVQQFDDFELELEWKAQTGANSGIMYLANEDNGASYFSAPEYQIFGDEDLTTSSNVSSGGVYALYSPMNKKLNPAGEVNHVRIVHCAGNLEHWLNGVLVLRARIGSVDWNQRVAASKFAAWKDFGTVKRATSFFRIMETMFGFVPSESGRSRPPLAGDMNHSSNSSMDTTWMDGLPISIRMANWMMSGLWIRESSRARVLLPDTSTPINRIRTSSWSWTGAGIRSPRRVATRECFSVRSESTRCGPRVSRLS